jgi:uncharacterized membrane protein
LDAQERAFQLSNLKPNKAAWFNLIDRALLTCGATLMIVGVMAFFAYNWADLHKFAKFALIQVAMVASVVFVAFKGVGNLSGKAALFGAAVLVGVLLAVYGQVYQTGADPYGLFLTWAILITGWALIGRNPGLWLLVVVLLNLTLIMYWQQIFEAQNWANSFVREFGPFAGITFSFTDFKLAQLVFTLNSMAIALWEFMARRDIAWLKGRTFPRIIAIFALYPIVFNTVLVIFLSSDEHLSGFRFVSPLLFIAFTITALYYYSKIYLDLFILAACLLSVIVVVTSLVGRWMSGDFEIFLLLSILVIAQSAGAAQWLRRVAKEMRATS